MTSLVLNIWAQGFFGCKNVLSGAMDIQNSDNSAQFHMLLEVLNLFNKCATEFKVRVLRLYIYNKGPGQPAHSQKQIRAFV